MEKEGVTGRDDLKKQHDSLDKMESRVPAIESEIQTYEKGANLFEDILKGIEQAGREMTRNQQRKQQKIQGKGKLRQRYQGLDRE